MLALFALLFAPSAHAQLNGLYQYLTGGTIVIPSNSTNTFYSYTLTNGVQNGVIVTNLFGAPGTSTNLAVNVSEYDYVGLTIAFTGTATSTNTLLLYKSFDNGANYESAATFSYVATPGAAAYVTNAALDIHGVTHLAFVSRANGTVASSTFASNAVVELNLKSPRLGFQQAGIGNGKNPGTPIVVPNGVN